MLTFNSLQNSQLIDLLKNSAVGVVPTDTQYGLVALASNKSAIKKLYKIKNRYKKPGTLIAANIDQLVELGFKRRYLKAVERFWPNPLSIVIPAPGLDYLHLGRGSLPIRIPKNKSLHQLLKSVGPLQTTSANLSGKPAATNIKQAQKIFGGKIDFYVDGGDLSNNEPSTIIEINDDAITILRVGACKIDEKGRISS